MRKLSVWIAVLLLGWTTAAPGLWAASQDTYREAYDAGFQDGSAVGVRHRENHLAYDFADDPAYLDATRGYDPQTHDREVYRVAYWQDVTSFRRVRRSVFACSTRWRPSVMKWGILFALKQWAM
ncbi:MAG: hypothetical protein P8Y94_12080 [Acidobacteriota bacterium]